VSLVLCAGRTHNGPMRVHLLLLARWFPPRIGGVESYLSSLYGDITPSRLTILAPRERGARDHDAQNPRYTIQRVRVGSSDRKLMLIGMVTVALRAVVREGVTQVHCGHVLLGVAGLVCKRLFGIPYIVFVFGSEVGAGRFRSWRHFVLCRADQVVTISTATAALLTQLGVSPRNITLVPPIVDSERYRPNSARRTLFRGLHHIASDTPVVLTVCRLSRNARHKGVDDLIESIAALSASYPNIRLVIVGDGDGRQALEWLAKDRGVASRTMFLGKVSPDELLDAYAGADIFVLANKEVPDGASRTVEGFGIVLLEAAASGLPAVATTIGGAPDAVENGVTGIIVDGSGPATVLAAIKALLDDPAERKAMGERARDRARRRHAPAVVRALFQNSTVSALSER
jgi:phosphatidyl-myo-inositol dimannoside synthase